MSWTLIYTKRALKDARLLRRSGLWDKANRLLDVIRFNPYQNPPPYEKLSADLRGYYSRRINRQHRLVYSVDEELETVFVVRMWTHYE